MGPMILLDRESLKQSKRFAEVYRPIAEQMGCDFLAADDVAKPGKADAVHMDAQAHRNLAEAVAKKPGKFWAERQEGIPCLTNM